MAAEPMEPAEERVEPVAELVEIDIEDHLVSLMGKVGLMVAMDQVVPDNQVDSEEDRRVVLVAQYLGHTKHAAMMEVQQVVPVMDN